MLLCDNLPRIVKLKKYVSIQKNSTVNCSKHDIILKRQEITYDILFSLLGSRDSGVSENHSRQSSGPYSSEENDHALEKLTSQKERQQETHPKINREVGFFIII